MKSSGVGSSSSLLDSIRILLISEAAPAGGVWSTNNALTKKAQRREPGFRYSLGLNRSAFGPENSGHKIADALYLVRLVIAEAQLAKRKTEFGASLRRMAISREPGGRSLLPLM
jgi:hypothetical protein